jgi:hypothetical protein
MRLRDHVMAPPPTTLMNSRRRMGEFRLVIGPIKEF